MIAFGPVPSRRLGRSLGINSIPPKSCTYSCRYCQVGPTPATEIEPRAFHAPERIVEAVAARLDRLAARNEEVDVLTLVPDGEPTLDVRLGETIESLRRFDRRIAVITNGSLLDRAEVRARLGLADWVSVKVDAATREPWRRVNRPHRALRLGAIQAGARAFARAFEGELVTETMLVDGINDDEEEVIRTARRVAELAPQKAYLSVPTRPGAVASTRPPHEETVARAYALFAERMEHVELLTGYEGDDFGATGDPEADVLAATAVHPMREAQVRALVARGGGDAALVERLVAERRLKRVAYRGRTFYLRTVRGV